MKNTSWDNFFKSSMKEDLKLREEYVKEQPDQQIMHTCIDFRKNLTFKEKAKLLASKRKSFSGSWQMIQTVQSSKI